MNHKQTFLAILAAILAQVIFGLSFLFTKICLNTSSALVVIANRYLVAFLGLTVVMVVTRTKFSVNKKIWKLLMMSLFQPIIYFLCETYGIQMTTSSFSAVMIAMIPIVAMIGGIFFLGEKPGFWQYICAFLSVGGVVLIAVTGVGEGSVLPFGILLLFFAVVASAGYNITSRLISKEFSVLERTYAMTLVGFISFTLLALIENMSTPILLVSSFANLEYTGGILYLGIVSSVVAFLCLNYANTHLPVSKTTVFSNLTTVVSVIAGVLILQEPFSKFALFGTIMIILGVVGVQSMQVKNTGKLEKRNRNRKNM